MHMQCIVARLVLEVTRRCVRAGAYSQHRRGAAVAAAACGSQGQHLPCQQAALCGCQPCPAWPEGDAGLTTDPEALEDLAHQRAHAQAIRRLLAGWFESAQQLQRQAPGMGSIVVIQG